MSCSALPSRARRFALNAAVLPVLALGCVSAAPIAAATSAAAPTASATADVTATTSSRTATSPVETSAESVAPTVQAPTARSGAAGTASLAESSSAAARPAQPHSNPVDAPRPVAQPARGGANKVFGMPAPKNPESAADDNALLAWTIKNATVAERRQMANEFSVAYPASVSILGSICDKGQGYVGVWVVNFAETEAHWNVTLDGVGYAGARVLPTSHDYGAIGVPNGRHTVAFVNPATGAVGARTVTSLHCGAKRSQTPAPVQHKKSPTRRSAPAGQPASPSRAASSAAATAPAAAPSARTHLGPRVQTDGVVVDSRTGSTPMLALTSAATGVLAATWTFVARRRRG